MFSAQIVQIFAASVLCCCEFCLKKEFWLDSQALSDFKWCAFGRWKHFDDLAYIISSVIKILLLFFFFTWVFFFFNA